MLRLPPSSVGGHRQLAPKNPALRQQLAVYKRTLPCPQLRPADRLFWASLVWMPAANDLWGLRASTESS